MLSMLWMKTKVKAVLWQFGQLIRLLSVLLMNLRLRKTARIAGIVKVWMIHPNMATMLTL